jgi:ADP-heptose:LPS heptosyltransferase
VLPKKILIIRFSAMGDVVLLTPVLRSLAAAYPEVEVVVCTRPKFTSFFVGISSVTTFGADVDTEYKGFKGLFRLFAALRKQRFDVVFDLHDHLRTKVLGIFFFLVGVPVITFKKGRADKKKFTRKENKATKPLPHTIERYHQPFAKAGFVFQIGPSPYLLPHDSSFTFVKNWLVEKHLSKKNPWIGIAPFAMHASKIWPTKNYAALIENLIQQKPHHFFLFGGGKKEIEFFENLQQQFPAHITIVAGQLKLDQELALMQQLDLMLCVDSSNMHLAALSGVPLLSIWGGTHPAVGFGPYRYGENAILQISREELPCRPCSVYGKETCHRGDFACLNWITPEIVSTKVQAILNSPVGKQV